MDEIERRTLPSQEPQRSQVTAAIAAARDFLRTLDSGLVEDQATINAWIEADQLVREAAPTGG